MSITFEIPETVNRELPDFLLFTENSISSCAASGNGFGMKRSANFWKECTPYLYELIAASALLLKSVETDFAVDSSGFSTGQFMRWLDVKYGKEEDRRMWLNVHLMCGGQNKHRFEISDGYANDYNYYKPLLETTAGNGFKMAEVSADKAYLGAPNLLTTLRHGAILYIPFKSNSKAGQSTYGAKSTLWGSHVPFLHATPRRIF